MAAVVSTYKVTYHFEQGGKKSGGDFINYLQASAGDYNSLKTVFSNNSKLMAGTLVFDSVQKVGHGDVALAYGHAADAMDERH